MSKGTVNKVFLIGNLGQDPEVRFMPNGNAVANVTLATSETWKDRNTGEQNERTEWHRIVFFRKLAEIVGDYCKKGSKVFIEGKLQTRKWQDQNGNDRYTTEVVADQMQMLDSRRDNSGGGQHTNNRSANAGNTPDGQFQQRAQPNTNGDLNDDIPF